MATQTVVVKKSGCGGGCLLLLVIFGIVGYLTTKTSQPFLARAIAEAKESGMAKKEARSKLTIADSSVSRSNDGKLLSSFTITNNGPILAKDFYLELDAFAPSGTRLNHLKATLFDMVQAGESKKIKNVSFGAADPQASGYSAPEIYECTFISAP